VKTQERYNIGIWASYVFFLRGDKKTLPTTTKTKKNVEIVIGKTQYL
jgi:hypothetical protein